MYVGLHVKCPLFLSDFHDNLIFSTASRNVLKHKISLKSVQWEPSCSMRTDGHDEASSRFSQFCERPQKYNRRYLKLRLRRVRPHNYVIFAYVSV